MRHVSTPHTLDVADILFGSDCTASVVHSVLAEVNTIMQCAPNRDAAG